MKTIYYNGDLITVNDKQPEAEALCVENGKILAVGKWADIKTRQDNRTALIDLQGKTMLPGFIESHGHIVLWALAGEIGLHAPPVGKVTSVKMMLEEMKRGFKEGKIHQSGWLVGSSYDNSFFEDKRHPTRADLDSISTEIPIVAYHASGHLAVVNSRLLETMGWDKNTPDPPGGVIQRDPVSGELNGILEEKACQAVMWRMIAISPVDKSAKVFDEKQKIYFSYGVTTAQEAAGQPIELEVLRYCQVQDMMGIDVVFYPLLEELSKFSKLTITSTPQARYARHVKIPGVKVIGDGSPQPGAKTAWLSAPYYKKPDWEPEGYRGYPIYTDEQMYAFCRQALEKNWQIVTHCNGDATADQFIKAYEKAKKDMGNTLNLRPVMIHAQTVREDQLEAMARLGIIPTFFHDHTYYWGDDHLDSVLGPERGKRISPLKSALNRGIPFTLHQDTPVVPPNQILALHNAVNRQTKTGREIGPEFAISPLQAIKAITINAAFQNFDENIKGSLEAGKYADLVILDKNPLKVPEEEIKEIKVLETIKEGKTIYQT